MSDSAQRDTKTIETLKSALIGLLFLLMGWIYNSHQKLEERVYNMQSNAMTTQAAEAMENRISKSIDSRFSDLSVRLDLLVKMLERQQNK